MSQVLSYFFSIYYKDGVLLHKMGVTAFISLRWTQCCPMYLHFIYFATMVACYSIPGFYPKEITHSFKLFTPY